MQPRREGEEPGVGRSGHTSRAEWAVAALGALMLLGVLANILYEALAEPNTPPAVEVTIGSIVRTRDGYLVEFQARNSGQQTAAGLVIEGVLRAEGGEVEVSEITMDYLPAESHRSGGLYFRKDPRGLQLEVRAKGYDLP